MQHTQSSHKCVHQCTQHTHSHHIHLFTSARNTHTHTQSSHTFVYKCTQHTHSHHTHLFTSARNTHTHSHHTHLFTSACTNFSTSSVRCSHTSPLYCKFAHCTVQHTQQRNRTYLMVTVERFHSLSNNVHFSDRNIMMPKCDEDMVAPGCLLNVDRHRTSHNQTGHTHLSFCDTSPSYLSVVPIRRTNPSYQSVVPIRRTNPSYQYQSVVPIRRNSLS